MTALFLDFDGVICDSIQECYFVANNAYFGHYIHPQNEDIKSLFFEFRGLVGPAHQYYALLEAIKQHVEGDQAQIPALFLSIVKKMSPDQKDAFEKAFFQNRNWAQENLPQWLALNPITPFGQWLQTQNTSSMYIITTKNRAAVTTLLEHYGLDFKQIYSNEEFKKTQSKGKIMSDFLDNSSEDHAVFVDDSTDHLDSVDDDRIRCLFCAWGYGKNSQYETLTLDTKEKVLNKS